MILPIRKGRIILEEFTFGPLEIFMVISAALFLICSVIAPIIGKKHPLIIAASAVSGIIGAAYLAVCTGLLYQLESDGFYNTPTDFLSDSHTPFTINLMILIYSIALLGAALPILCMFRKLKTHKNKLFNIYAIVSAVCFVSFGISMFTTYAQYSNLFAFLPLHFAFSLFVCALSMLDSKITSQLIKAVISISVLFIITVGEMLLLEGASVPLIIIGVILTAAAIIAFIGEIIVKRSVKTEKTAVQIKGE